MWKLKFWNEEDNRIGQLKEARVVVLDGFDVDMTLGTRRDRKSGVGLKAEWSSSLYPDVALLASSECRKG